MPSIRTSTKTLSVYGGAGGQGTRISSSFKPGSIYGSCQSNPAADFTFCMSGNEKATMQNLNSRLASVIQKVQSLKNSNSELERKIHDWTASHTVAARNYSQYMATIESLHEQIQHISHSNTETVLNIENASLCANDFRQLYKTEVAFRKSVETDAAYVRKQMDEMTLIRSTLEMEYESLKEERILLQKNHEEISTLEKKFTEQTDDLESMTTKVRTLKTYFHELQIDRDTKESMNTSLEANLQDSSTLYAAQLAEFQKIINDLESKLKEIRDNITAKKKDSDTLEVEIKKYRLLLEEMNSDVQVARKKIAVIKVVESSETVSMH
ncbi:Keratin, type I cytoskeletal 19 [Bagarius yarrelli]|uniref:Keratin, type I cytoskeletal 19 n=1 Tax=Bagarius yarrelli TaxID=175774 RepID=A0A556U5V1_BAGYA|nr:Keratin, type I cytoskeletal 19 [Bagarius yarrelli]